MLWKRPLPDADDALPGRLERSFSIPATHYVLDTPLEGPFDGYETAVFGLGCFWGAERLYWTLPGIWSTAVGYAGGHTPNPTYREVCSGRTAHTEAVLVVFDPAVLPYETLLTVFWEGHNPTQGNRQGNDRGTQYRSAIYTTTPDQLSAAVSSEQQYGTLLDAAGFSAITTEIAPLTTFWYAEGYHQQYLAKNPGGYCGLGGTGIACTATG